MRVKVNKFNLSAARKRQLAIAGMVAGGMAAIVGSAVYVIEGNKKNQPKLHRFKTNSRSSKLILQVHKQALLTTLYG